MPTYYKFTEKDGKAFGGFQWPLPTKNPDGTWTPGKWTKKISGDLEPCKNGYHFCSPDWVAPWIDAEMYEIEFQGEIVKDDDHPEKFVCRRARLVRHIETWNEKTARLFAVRCARDALSLTDNPDPRSVVAIDTAEKYANGNATNEELTAARVAARAAAGGTTRDSACDSARVAGWVAARAAGRAAGRKREVAWAAAWIKYSGWLLEMVGEKTGENHAND